MLRLMGNETTKVSTNDAMPCVAVFLVELFLDVLGDVLLNVKVFNGPHGKFFSGLLHLWLHIGRLDLDFVFILGTGHSYAGHFFRRHDRDCIGVLGAFLFVDLRSGSIAILTRREGDSVWIEEGSKMNELMEGMIG
uniref:Uncharacterized protein n=1 Tax=Medicago truncatula TaxID=3880 RepID=I3SBV0_MEDTR|nr:unknown [Medicago truncatula]